MESLVRRIRTKQAAQAAMSAAAAILAATAALLPAAAGTGESSQRQEAAASVLPEEGEFLTGDDEWGCQLLLCFSGDWKSVRECHPPVRKFISCRARKHNPCSMPGCPSGDDSCYAQLVSGEPYDPCSQLGDGLEDAPAGWLAEGTLSDASMFAALPGGTFLKKKGSSAFNWNGSLQYTADGETYSSKACARPEDFEGTAIERYACLADCGDGGSCPATCSREVLVYREITWQEM